MKLYAFMIILAAAFLTVPVTAEESAEEPKSTEEPPPVDFPAELTLPMDRIPEPAHRSILQRIDDHQRLDQVLSTPPPGDIPIEVRPVEGGDQIRIRLR